MHLKGDLAKASQNRFGYEAIGRIHALGGSLLGRGLEVLGTFNAGGFVNQDSRGFTSTVKAVGKQAGIGSVQRVVDVVKLGSLGHDHRAREILSVSLRPRQSVVGKASGGLART